MSEHLDKSDQAITEIATEWFLKFRDGQVSDRDSRQFARWLKDSPVHVHEYLSVARTWGALGRLDSARSIPDMDVSRLPELPDNVVLMAQRPGSEPRPAPQGPTAHNHRFGHPAFKLLAAVLVCALALSIFLHQSSQPAAEQMSTRRGEQKSLVLEDGSFIQMNTSTRISVWMTRAERHVKIATGEVIFKVHKNPQRPFIVDTGNALIRVYGTEFNVYKQSSRVAVTVIEGKVSVSTEYPEDPATGSAGEPGGETVQLVHGQQAIVKTDSPAIESRQVTGLNAIVAWTSRRLIFDDLPLEKIIAEFSRYTDMGFVHLDHGAARIRLSGAFDSYDPDSLIKYLQSLPEVNVAHSGNEYLISTQASANPPPQPPASGRDG